MVEKTTKEGAVAQAALKLRPQEAGLPPNAADHLFDGDRPLATAHLSQLHEAYRRVFASPAAAARPNTPSHFPSVAAVITKRFGWPVA
jgi:hypothetical protein